MYVPLGAYFLLEIDNIIHALGYRKHEKKSTQSLRQLVRKFHAFSNQNQRCLHVQDKSGIPLKSWRAVTWNVTNKDLMISAPLIISFFYHETDDWINCQVQILPVERWFGQPI